MSQPKDQERFFRTDHLMADLSGRAVRGGAITLSAQAVKFLLQLGSTVVLARLLTPDDFGLVAMVTAVTGFVALFKDLGLSQATVQRPQITHEQVSTLFWVNVAASFVLMLVVAALAPLLAWFFGDPRLTEITLVIAGTFILSGLSVQHSALLTRQMRFKWLALIDVAGLAAGVLAALVLAWQGFGYWSLVGMLVIQSTLGATLVWLTSEWRPGRPVRGSGVRPMLRFGGNLAGFNVLNYFSRNADKVLIGWAWGAGALGTYSRAYQLLTLPLSQINWPLSRVVIPALSRLNDRPEEYRWQYLYYLSAVLWLTLPLVGLLAGAAPSVVLVLLGEQWSEVSGVFRALCITAALQPVYSTIGWIFVSKGRTDRFLRWALIASPLFVLSFVVGLPWGVVGVALSYAATFVLMLPWTLGYAVRETAIRRADIFDAARHPFLAALVCCFVCLSIEATDLSAASTLMVCLVCVVALAVILLALRKDLRSRLKQIYCVGVSSANCMDA
jgi:PST family polysaccharide transporter